MKNEKSKFLVPQCLSALAPSKKSAFTLAEVLITLAIIGVVAAMTIPTLISDYKEKATITKVKTFYSLLSQTIALSEVDNGPTATWTFSDVNEFANYITPYLKITRDCGQDSGCISSDVYKRLNGEDHTSYDTSNRYYKILLTNGMSVWFRIKDDPTNNDGEDLVGTFWLDINGKNAPNQIGVDTFTFTALKDKGVVPDRGDSCYINDKGFGCAAYILKYENMDYPTKEIEEEVEE